MKKVITQMNIYVLMIGFPTLLLFSSGCGQRYRGVPAASTEKANFPGKPGAYVQGSGNCSPAFEYDYNTVVMSINYSVDDFKKSENLVNDFSKKYGAAKCQTSLQPGDKLDAVSATIEVSAKVIEWKNAIAGQIETAEKTIPTAPSREVSIQSLPSGLKLEVLDAEKMNQLLNLGGPNYLQNGKIVFRGMDNGMNFCGWVIQKSVTVKLGDRIPLQNLDQKKGDLTSNSNDGTVVMLCHLRKGSTDWKVKDLDQIFGEIARVIL